MARDLAAAGRFGISLSARGFVHRVLELVAPVALLAAAAVSSQPAHAQDTQDPVPIQVAAGDTATCARWSDGRVACWGTLNLGHTPGAGPSDPQPTPRFITGISHAIDLSVGARHACAVVLGGQVLCWGVNNHGELGDGSRISRSEPRPASGLSNVVEVAAGASVTCAITQARELYCWGRNHWGVLGRPSTGAGAVADATTPTRVTTSLAGLLHVALGSESACVIAAEGRVYCWSSSVLGGRRVARLPTAPSPGQAARLHKVAGVGPARMLGLGVWHACALRDDDTVRCWGVNWPEVTHRAPHRIMDEDRAPEHVQGIQQAEGLAVGAQHACVYTTSGALTCWGSQAGAPNLGGLPRRSRRPSGIRGLRGVSGATAGTSHVCVIASEQLMCFGDNTWGQLGTGNTASADHPVAVVPPERRHRAEAEQAQGQAILRNLEALVRNLERADAAAIRRAAGEVDRYHIRLLGVPGYDRLRSQVATLILPVLVTRAQSMLDAGERDAAAQIAIVEAGRWASPSDMPEELLRLRRALGAEPTAPAPRSHAAEHDGAPEIRQSDDGRRDAIMLVRNFDVRETHQSDDGRRETMVLVRDFDVTANAPTPAHGRDVPVVHADASETEADSHAGSPPPSRIAAAFLSSVVPGSGQLVTVHGWG